MMREELHRASLNQEEVTVREALLIGTELLSRRAIDSARIDAEVLLGMVLGQGREALWRDLEAPLKTAERIEFQRALERRARREPVAYITGHKEFWSLDFLVTPDVLVPRPETEVLVEAALDLLTKLDRPLPHRMLDLGAGSGAIAVSLAKELREAEIWATDLSSAALKVAETNALRHGVREKIHFLRGDLFEPCAEGGQAFHLIVSNPPYVRRGDIENLPAEVRDWEPRLALDGGRDGLDFCRRIIPEGGRYLADGGWMVLEIGADMREMISRLFVSAGRYSEGSVYRDYAGRDRVFAARKLPAE